MIVFRHALNDNVKKSGVMASSYVGGLNSRAFIPVNEDHGMIQVVQRGTLTLEKLEAMTFGRIWRPARICTSYSSKRLQLRELR